MKKLISMGFVAVLAIVLAGCGSSSGGTTTSSDTLAPTDIGDLPNATSPMASASASVSTKGVYKSATTGLPLLTASTSSFQATDSMAACQVTNVVKDAFISAAQSDQILCYVKYMADLFGTGGNNPFDGNEHIYNLDVSNDEGAPSKVKLQIQKDATTGVITSFVMYMCNNADTQTGYNSQTLSSGSLTMASRGTFSGGGWTGGYQVDVSGTLNAAGAYTQRTISIRNSGTETSNTHWQEATVTQTPAVFTLNGYQKGTYSMGGNSGSYEEAAYANGELLNDTSSTITDIAIGDGAVKADAAYSGTFGSESFSFDPSAEVFAWLGDTMAALEPASGSSSYANANAGTIPTPAANFSITFDAGQTWDCTDGSITAVTLPAVDGTAMDAACNQFNQSSSWIDCYSAIGQSQNQ